MEGITLIVAFRKKGNTTIWSYFPSSKFSHSILVDNPDDIRDTRISKDRNTEDISLIPHNSYDSQLDSQFSLSHDGIQPLSSSSSSFSSSSSGVSRSEFSTAKTSITSSSFARLALPRSSTTINTTTNNSNITNNSVTDTTKVSSQRQPFVFTIDNSVFVSYPVFVGSPWLTEEEKLIYGSTNPNQSFISSSSLNPASGIINDEESIVGWSIVLCGKRQYSHQHQSLQLCAKRIGEILLLLNHLDGYMVKEIQALVQENNDQHYLTTATSSLSSSSSLLTNLITITNQLITTGQAYIDLPYNIPLSLSIQPYQMNYLSPVPFHKQTLSSLINAYSSGWYNNYSTNNMDSDNLSGPPIRPFHALLLLTEPENIIHQVPIDSSPQLLATIWKAIPTRSLHELQTETGISSSALLRIAGHLVYHRLATIVDCISEESKYSVTSLAATVSNAEETEFQQFSPDITLHSFLSLFSKTAAEGLTLRLLMSDLPINSRNIFIQCLTWLLKKGYIRQQHTYIHCLWPWVLRRKVTTSKIPNLELITIDMNNVPKPSSPLVSTVSENIPSISNNTYMDWGPEELEFAAALCTNKPTEIQILFRRILVYLRNVYQSLLFEESTNINKKINENISLQPQTNIKNITYHSTMSRTTNNRRRNGASMNPGFSSKDFPVHSNTSALLLACRIEEIMYQLRVTRAQLLEICEIFSPWLTLQQEGSS